LKERSYRGRWAEGSDPLRYDDRRALSPSDTYEFNEAIGFAEAYSVELGEIKQKIFRLMMDEVPNKEIARECNMTESAVNAVICRMRADLRNKLRRLNSFYGPMNCAC
jgi:DNA-directed RNA polymerase specialized sigma24 family protein